MLAQQVSLWFTCIFSSLFSVILSILTGRGYCLFLGRPNYFQLPKPDVTISKRPALPTTQPPSHGGAHGSAHGGAHNGGAQHPIGGGAGGQAIQPPLLYASLDLPQPPNGRLRSDRTEYAQVKWTRANYANKYFHKTSVTRYCALTTIVSSLRVDRQRNLSLKTNFSIGINRARKNLKGWHRS